MLTERRKDAPFLPFRASIYCERGDGVVEGAKNTLLFLCCFWESKRISFVEITRRRPERISNDEGSGRIMKIPNWFTMLLLTWKFKTGRPGNSPETYWTKWCRTIDDDDDDDPLFFFAEFQATKLIGPDIRSFSMTGLDLFAARTTNPFEQRRISRFTRSKTNQKLFTSDSFGAVPSRQSANIFRKKLG